MDLAKMLYGPCQRLDWPPRCTDLNPIERVLDTVCKHTIKAYYNTIWKLETIQSHQAVAVNFFYTGAMTHREKQTGRFNSEKMPNANKETAKRTRSVGLFVLQQSTQNQYTSPEVQLLWQLFKSFHYCFNISSLAKKT